MSSSDLQKNEIFLFLDVDGVLNNTLSATWFDGLNLLNLKNLCKLLGNPKIILSSDWRKNEDSIKKVRVALNTVDLILTDCTPILSDVRERSGEIALWLDGKTFSKAFILDDMPAEFVDPDIENVLFIKTDPMLGLTEDDVDLINSLMRNE